MRAARRALPACRAHHAALPAAAGCIERRRKSRTLLFCGGRTFLLFIIVCVLGGGTGGLAGDIGAPARVTHTRLRTLRCHNAFHNICATPRTLLRAAAAYAVCSRWLSGALPRASVLLAPAVGGLRGCVPVPSRGALIIY